MSKTARLMSPLYALACTALLAWASATQATQTPQPSAPGLMPLPAKIETQAGRYQPKAGAMRIALEGDARELEALAAQASDIVQATGRTPPEMAADGARADLTLQLAPETTTTGPESYTLRVDAQGIRLQAASAAGLFHGLQTLRQLLEQSGGEGIGFVTIEDAPRFARAVWIDFGDLDAAPQDNALTLAPGETVSLRVDSPASQVELRKALRVRSLADMLSRDQ